MSGKKTKGSLSINSFGAGYVLTEDLGEDVKIEASLLNTALHGDEVEVFLFPQKKNQKRKGEVVKILKRAKTRFVGTVQKAKKRSYAFVVADDRKMHKDIFVPECKVKNNKKVLVEVVDWGDARKSPEGKVVEVIGEKGDNDAELHSIVLEKGLSVGFPKKVEKEAIELKKKKINKKDRRDFTDCVVFTIDPKDAKDFDDAISIKHIEEDVYEIGVHIADVSHYVKEGALLDKEARERAFSIYLVDRTIPMLPEVISNDVCSLNPQEEKLVFSVVFKINKQGVVFDRWVGEAVICSQKKFSYEEAQKVLDDEVGPFCKELQVLKEVAQSLLAEREKRGALEIDSDELLFELDSDGRPLAVYPKQSLFAHSMIEELMILANRTVAERFNTFYRIHEKPDSEIVEKLFSFVNGLGYDIRLEKKNITTFDLNRIIKKTEDDDKSFLVKKNVLRSMAKAEYAVKNRKHFGLALEKYTHFTSPIRRYADLCMHRIIKDKLKKKEVDVRHYEKIAREISWRELDVLDAERSSVQYKQVEYMQDGIGKEFQVIISGVTDFGVFVQEVESKAEGMVSVKDMGDDYYVLDEENYRLIGTRKGRRYSLGSKMKAKLVRCSLSTRQLDFVFVD